VPEFVALIAIVLFLFYWLLVNNPAGYLISGLFGFLPRSGLRLYELLFSDSFNLFAVAEINNCLPYK
jgi:hypothetical protein